MSEKVDSMNLKRLRAEARAHRRRAFIKGLFSRKIVAVAAIGLVFIVLVAIFAPVIAPFDPDEAHFADSRIKPNSTYLLGTDEHGRDVLSRIIYGSRVSLIIGVVAVLVACAVGTFLGMLAGYVGGVVDDIITRISETIRAIPQIIFAMALTAAFGSSIVSLSIILGISNTVGYIRMMRAQVLSAKEQDYIMAARLQGNSRLRIMLKHILPNSISPIIVLMTQQVGNTILAEAGLSFLGLGISAPTASWGSMVNGGRMYLMQNPVYALAPGVCVALLVICLNTFGDGVRDALDPRLRGEL